jgi:hypothetical protein
VKTASFLHRFAPLAVALLVVALIVSSCSSSGTLSIAARVADHDISMDQYNKFTRFWLEVNRISADQQQTGSGPEQFDWQSVIGRSNLSKIQRISLQILVNTVFLDNEAKKLKVAPKEISDLEESTLQQVKENTKTTFESLYQSGVMNDTVLHEYAHYQALTQKVIPAASVNVATVKILSFKTEKEASDALKSLKDGSKDWASFTDASVDPFKGQISGLTRYLIPKIDSYIFEQKHKPTDYSPIQQTLWGWSILQVSELKMTKIADLDVLSPIVSGISPSVVAPYTYLLQMEKDSNIDIQINWCNSISGADCGVINPFPDNPLGK